MDNELIAQKLESLRRSLRRIEEKCPSSAEALAGDFDLQDIVAINLTRAIQLCVDIGAHLIANKDTPPPNTMGQTFDVLAKLGTIDLELAARMKKAVGFRNIAVHNYEAINWQIVHAIATNHLNDFKAFAQAIVRDSGL
jgi:uncharacterized protein YutE (UPF0331/DUF86 family)